MSLLLLASLPYPLEERVCRSNAVELSSDDGINMCSIQSLVIVYLHLVRLYCSFVQALVLYNVIILRRTLVQNSYVYQIGAVLIVGLFMPILMYRLEMYGYSVEKGLR
jgi:hypothetical protein